MRIELDGVIFRFHSENIEEQDEWNEDYFEFASKKYVCCDCGTLLNYKYRIIMTLLDEALLLPDDFRHFCCHCSFLDKAGLLDLRKNLSTADVIDDTVVLGFYIDDGDKEVKLEIRVHNYKKVLLE